MKKIVLFDMDGTITPARKKIEWEMIDALTDLQRAGFEIGIVTGSDMEYVEQQMNLIFDLSTVDPFKIHYLPCNGTKYYRMDSSGFKAVYENNMREYIGNEKWSKIIKILINLQSSMINLYDMIPAVGRFINYRGSMINWCPIGRQAEEQDRTQWCLWDRRQNIRETMYKIARQGLNNSDLEDIIIKMGGETSFDIYPEGWDKTFAFNNFKDYDKIYFVGDRCFEHGNDREAFLKAGEFGYSTSGPNETIEIIKKIIKEG